MEAVLRDTEAEKEKLEWSLREKEILVGKLEKEMVQIREELNSKSY